MTGGFNQDGSGRADGSSHLPPRDDRETLSALLDGELPGDAARFAIKRLSHDVQWRETCGRWQLIGDAMRGEALALAPHDFAAGVARALEYPDAESAPAAASGIGPMRAVSRGRWIGGVALAASLAVAAVLVVKPFMSPTPSQSVPTVAETAVPAAGSALPAPASTAPADVELAGGGETFAAAPAPSIPVSPVATARASTRSPAVRVAARSVPAPAPDTAVAAAAPSSGPFQPPMHEVASRPWPRAVLPGASAEGGYTVGFGETTDAPSPAFYPFEPQPTSAAPQEDESSP